MHHFQYLLAFFLVSNKPLLIVTDRCFKFEQSLVGRNFIYFFNRSLLIKCMLTNSIQYFNVKWAKSITIQKIKLLKKLLTMTVLQFYVSICEYFKTKFTVIIKRLAISFPVIWRITISLMTSHSMHIYTIPIIW